MAGEINEGTVRQTSHTPLRTTRRDRFVLLCFLCLDWRRGVKPGENYSGETFFSFSFFLFFLFFMNVDVFAWWSPDGS